MLIEVELLNSRFEYLNSLPKINTGSAEDEDGIICNTHTLINGRDVTEGDYPLESSGLTYPECETIEEAITLTENTIKTILKNHKKVWLRVFPNVRRCENGTYLARTRLAYR